MKMKTPPSFMHANGDYLLHCDCLGTIQVWDISKMKCILRDVSLSPLLDLKVVTLELKVVGGASIVIEAKSTKSQTFIYNHDLCVWNCTSFKTGLIPSIEDVETQLATAVFTNDSTKVIYWLKIFARRLTESSNLLKVEELVNEFK
jgi:WD40 repeat protein